MEFTKLPVEMINKLERFINDTPPENSNCKCISPQYYHRKNRCREVISDAEVNTYCTYGGGITRTYAFYKMTNGNVIDIEIYFDHEKNCEEFVSYQYC